MELIVIGHLLGDFYLQTDALADKKRKSIGWMTAHCLAYSIIIYIMFWILGNNWWVGIAASVAIGLFHFVIDEIKIIVENKIKNIDRYSCFIFLGDQVVHLLVLFVVMYCWNINADLSISHWYFANMQKVCIIGIALLICCKPAAIFVALVFKIIPKTIEESNWVKDEKATYIPNMEYIKKEESKIGSWIGILEREIILILGLMGQYGAIGFVLTAKSIARFKQLENKAFAEKYLVGTLLSAFIAIASIAVCSVLI